MNTTIIKFLLDIFANNIEFSDEVSLLKHKTDNLLLIADYLASNKLASKDIIVVKLQEFYCNQRLIISTPMLFEILLKKLMKDVCINSGIKDRFPLNAFENNLSQQIIIPIYRNDGFSEIDQIIFKFNYTTIPTTIVLYPKLRLQFDQIVEKYTIE